MPYSVVMATRRGEPFIEEALGSILSQTHPPVRVHIVVNGPGADNPGAVPTACRAHPDVEVHVRLEPGQPGALAEGIRLVDTPYVGFLDADDVWQPEKQERQIARLESDPSLHAVSCEVTNFHVLPDGTRMTGKRATTRMFSAVTFRRDAFDRFGSPDPSVGHFRWLYRWWAEVQRQGISTAAIPYTGVLRRVHDSNGWVTHGEEGRVHLLRELRRIHASRRIAAPNDERAGA
jgi:glycosyltransferase involved in cell wall biosynthesis